MVKTHKIVEKNSANFYFTQYRNFFWIFYQNIKKQYA
jgi:hypothetical protein